MSVVVYDIDKINKIIELIDKELCIKGITNIKTIANIHQVITEDPDIREEILPQEEIDRLRNIEQLYNEQANKMKNTTPEVMYEADEDADEANEETLDEPAEIDTPSTEETSQIENHEEAIEKVDGEVVE